MGSDAEHARNLEIAAKLLDTELRGIAARVARGVGAEQAKLEVLAEAMLDEWALRRARRMGAFSLSETGEMIRRRWMRLSPVEQVHRQRTQRMGVVFGRRRRRQPVISGTSLLGSARG